MRNIDLTKGNILTVLIELALPIMATSFIQMAYNLTDMLWIGKLGANAVASVGAAGMFMWFSNGLIMVARMGGQVKCGQLLGAKKYEKAGLYAANAILFATILALGFGAISLLFSSAMIGFFAFDNMTVVNDAKMYLMITCGFVIFSFLNQIYTALLSAAGNSKSSFIVNTIGLVFNIILDPLLIFGIGSFSGLGVKGAAFATVFSQFCVTILFQIVLAKEKLLFPHVSLRQLPKWAMIKEMIRIGGPTGLQNMLFSSISMGIARMVSGFGEAAVAVQKIGSQIESISWMTSDGFAASLNSFTAQNYGANLQDRVKKGFRIALRVMIGWGIFTTLVLFLGSERLFSIFISEQDVIPLGIDYLQILACSQLFMCIEITTSGVLTGLGITMPSAIVSVVFNFIRLPLSALLIPFMGLNGIWWSITLTSIIKGITILSYYLIKRHHSEV